MNGKRCPSASAKTSKPGRADRFHGSAGPNCRWNVQTPPTGRQDHPVGVFQQALARLGALHIAGLFLLLGEVVVDVTEVGTQLAELTRVDNVTDDLHLVRGPDNL